MKTVTILGAGVMGSAMTLPFADRGYDVRLVGTHLDGDIVESVREKQFHPKLKVTLPASVKIFPHDEFVHAVGNDTDLILLGVASAGVGWAIDRLCETLTHPIPVLMITKGMHPENTMLAALPDVVSQSLTKRLGFDVPVAAIGGPCIAGELAVRRHTGTVIASHDMALSNRLCADLETDYYHPRSSNDMIGVETCAAFKNFFAIAVGWAHGAQEQLPPSENSSLNNNAAAVIFDQAVRELMILTTALGGTAESVWGMPGVGDLYVTCQAGRNSRLGNNLGRGLSFHQTRNGPMKGDTIEGAELGVATASSLRAMMKKGLFDEEEMPLTVALLHTLTTDAPLDIAWKKFHRAWSKHGKN
jgi:glycerol-3-phosphate dehydrogenase (NAD(P)+)